MLITKGILLGYSLLQMTPIEKSRPKTTQVAPAPQESLELKMAKIWSRFDELEIKVQKQAERIKLLEKGLMLGVIPEELLRDKLSLEADSSNMLDLDKDEVKPSQTSNEISDEREQYSYSELLKKAQKAFASGKYGLAISFYQRIDQSYPESVREGQTKYWIGLSWFYLKEFNRSEEALTALIMQHKDSKWIGQANYYIGKISVEKGLYKKALDQLKLVIDEYPNSDVSEMASYEIKLLREKI